MSIAVCHAFLARRGCRGEVPHRTARRGGVGVRAGYVRRESAWDPCHINSGTRPGIHGRSFSWCTALLWIVPAKVEGTWQLPQGALTLTQKFQMVSGMLGKDAVSDGRLRGDEISFTAGGMKYTGKVNGNMMSSTVGGSKWSATRK